MTKYESLLSDAAQLPITDRIELIEALWDTVPEESQLVLSSEWLAEIGRRSGEFDDGAATPIAWETIKTEALLRLKRQSD